MKNPSLTVGRGRMRRIGCHARAILPALALAAASLATAPPSRADESGWEEAPADDEAPPPDEPAQKSDDTVTTPVTPEPSGTTTAPPVSSVSSSSVRVSGCNAAPAPEPAPPRPASVPVGAALELSYGRLVLPVGGTTFSASGWPDKKGRELGFQNPLAHVLAFRSSFIVEPHFGVTYGMNFAWARSDATGTDPLAQQTTGWAFASDFFDLGVEGVESVGPLTLRAGGSLGPRLLMVGMDHRSSNGNSNAMGSFQFYVRPRVAAELALGDTISLGAYVSDDILRTTSVGVGAYVSFRTDAFEQH